MTALLAAGCSSLPMEPVADVESVAPTGPARTATEGRAKQPNLPEPGPGTSVSNRVIGIQGGSLHAGQFTVVIPAGAFQGQATITVSQPDLAEPRVDLSIWPAAKNNFNVPVTLIADMPAVTSTQLAGSKVRELVPASGYWMAMSGQTTDFVAKQVQVSLAHFSSYRVDVPAVGNSEPGGGSGRRY